MKKTGFLFDRRYMLHETSDYHPEIHERLDAIYKGINEADLLQKLTLINGSRADLKWIEAVHDKDYIHSFTVSRMPACPGKKYSAILTTRCVAKHLIQRCWLSGAYLML